MPPKAPLFGSCSESSELAGPRSQKKNIQTNPAGSQVTEKNRESIHPLTGTVNTGAATEENEDQFLGEPARKKTTPGRAIKKKNKRNRGLSSEPELLELRPQDFSKVRGSRMEMSPVSSA